MTYIPQTQNRISTLNARAASTLAASAVYQGTGEDVSAYGRVGISITSDNATDGVLTIEVSRDNVTWGGPTRDYADTRFSEPHMWNIVEQYFRIKYTNGTTEATNLAIQVQYSVNADTLLGHQLDAQLLDETEAIITRSVLVGETTGGDYINVPVDNMGQLKTSLPLTAFGDLRVAELSPVYQVSFEYTVTNGEIGIIEIENSGTVTQADAMCVVSTGTTTGSTAEWEIARHVKYRAGLGGLARFTGLFSPGVVGTEQMVGIADTEGSSASHKNGYAVGYDGDTFGFLRWQDDVLITVAMSTWDDPLDGTGHSGMTLDPTKLNVYFIEFQYLGGGAIKVWVEHDATGSMILAHTVPYANLNTVPSIYNPNFHLMAHAINGATTSDIIVKTASMAFFIEGKTKYTELQQPQQTSEKQTKSAVTTEVAIFTVRNKAVYASKANFIDIILEFMSMAIEAGSPNNLAAVRLVRNATLGGTPSWSDIHVTDSIVEIDTTGTTVSGGKTLIDVDLAGKNDRDSEDLTPYDIILTPGESITLAATSANSADINGSLLWKELF